MPGGRNKVGEVYYEVTADNQVQRGMLAAEADAARSVAKISAMEAKVEIEGDISDLKSDIAKAEAYVKAMNNEKIIIDMEVRDLRKLKKEMAEAEKPLRQISGQLTQAENKQERYNRAIKYGRAELEAYGSQMKVRGDALRLVNRAVADNTRLERENAKAIGATTKSTAAQALEVAKLEEKYIKLHAAKRKADMGIKGLHSRADKVRLNRVQAEIDLVKEQMQLAGRSETEIGELDRTLARNTDRWARWGASIAGTRVHLGFFSTTLSGMMRIMVAFGPIILSVLGSLASLISVAGAGLMGALSVGSAAFTGFGLSILGATLALKPVLHEMGNAMSATTAYSDAVQKYGKNSSEAKTAQENLNNSIKNMPPEAQKAFRSLGQMRQQFDRIAGPGIRKDFFGSFAEGVKTASALMPTFARGSREAFGAASAGFNKWMQGMRSNEAKRILGDIMGNFAKSIPGIMAGLGHLGTAFARIQQSASTFMPSLSKGFESWAESIKEGLGTGDTLTQRVGRWVNAMQKVGHFAQAAGKSLSTFFGIGVGPGGGFLDSMTRSLNRWNKEMQRNPETTREFFTQAIGLMEQLGPAVGRALITLAHAAQVLSPAIEGIATVLNGFLDVISSIPGPVLTAVGALYALNKILTVVTGANLARGALSMLFGSAGPALLTGAAAGLGGVGLAMGAVAAGALAMGAGIYFGLRGIKDTIPLHTQLNQAANRLSHTMVRQQKALQESAAAQKNYNRTLKDRQATAGEVAAAIKRHTEAEEEEAKAISAQKDALNDARGAMQQYRTLKEQVRDAEAKGLDQNSRFAGVIQSQRAELQRTAGAVANYRLQLLNMNRVQQGMGALSSKLAPQMAKLRQVFGKQITSKVSLMGSNQVVGQTAKLSRELARLGGKRTVMRILMSDDNAAGKLQRLATQADKAAKTRRIRVLLDAGRTRTEIGSLVRDADKTEKPKKIPITTTAPAARAQVSGLASEIQSIPDGHSTITVTTIHKNVGRPGGYSGGVMATRNYAWGGEPSQGTLDRAAITADRKAVRQAGPGARITSPTYLTGELSNDNEWVITDNPTWRRSNRSYLQDAASSLGMMVVPAYAAGAHASKKKKKGKKGPSHKDDFVYDTPTAGNPGANAPAAARYNYWTDEIERLAALFSDDRRKYDRTGQPPVSVLVGYLNQQYSAYGSLAVAIQNLLNTPAGKAIPGKKMAKGKSKAAKKKREQQRTYNQNVSSFNKSRDDGFETLRDELSAIGFQKLGLLSDIQELTTGTQGNLAAEAFSAARERYSAFQQYGSTVGVGPFSPIGGGSAATPHLSPPSAGFASSSRMSSIAGDGGTSATSSVGGATVINNFSAPPPDPHTWSQQQAFELAAL